MDRLRIGDVATRSGVTRDAIRFYERAGLLEQPGRTKSRHRIYDATILERIRLVRQLQNCGLTIGDIKEILFLQDADRPVASKRLTEILRKRLGFRKNASPRWRVAGRGSSMCCATSLPRVPADTTCSVAFPMWRLLRRSASGGAAGSYNACTPGAGSARVAVAINRCCVEPSRCSASSRSRSFL